MGFPVPVHVYAANPDSVTTQEAVQSCVKFKTNRQGSMDKVLQLSQGAMESLMERVSCAAATESCSLEFSSP